MRQYPNISSGMRRLALQFGVGLIYVFGSALLAPESLIGLKACQGDQTEIDELSQFKNDVKEYWDAVHSIEYTATSHQVDAVGLPDISGLRLKEYRAVASGGKSATSLSVIQDIHQEKIVHDTRMDGIKRYHCFYLDGNSDKDKNVMKSIKVTKQTSTLVESLEDATWVVFPGGKRIDELSNTSTNTRIVANGRDRRAILTNRLDQDRTLACELDSSHDWLPIKVTLTAFGESCSYEVTRFFRKDGRWFPREGTKVYRKEGVPTQRIFEIHRVNINGELPADTFGLPAKIEPGVTILDETVKGKSTRIVGGMSARDAFFERHHVTSESPKKSNSPPLHASTIPEQTPWALILGIMSVVSIMGALSLGWTHRTRS